MDSNFERLDEELVDRIRRLSTPALADTRDEGVEVVSSAIAPVHATCEFVGEARTVQLDPDGLVAPIWTLDTARRGDVVVVDADDATGEAVWGELLSTYADRVGVVATVTNGAVRDVEGIRALSYPVFARDRAPLGPSGTGEDAADVTVTVGGATIDPGDVLVGDEDGVVVLRRDAVGRIVRAAEQVEEKERTVRRRIDEGESLEDSFQAVGLL